MGNRLIFKRAEKGEGGGVECGGHKQKKKME
jgi:hypothetical protein